MCDCPLAPAPVAVLYTQQKQLEALDVHGSFPGLPPPAWVRPCSCPAPSMLHKEGKIPQTLCLIHLLGSILMGMLLAFHLGDWHQLPACEQLSLLPTLGPKREPQQCVLRIQSLSLLRGSWLGAGKPPSLIVYFKTAPTRNQPSCLLSFRYSRSLLGLCVRRRGLWGTPKGYRWGGL